MLAAGVTSAIEDENLVVVTIGYGIMRLGLIASWLRVARDHPIGRRRAMRFVVGLTVLQVLWFMRLALPDGSQLWIFAVLAVGELSVPVWAERAGDRPLFHPEHIEERYGLFTIILLGESILSATAGFQSAVDDAGLSADLLAVGLSGLVSAFAAWWLYFYHPGHLAPEPAQAFRWGYAHVVLFTALAAMGAGVHVAAEAVTGHGDQRVAALAVAIPSGLFLLGLALVMTITGSSALDRRVAPKLGAGVLIVIVGSIASVVATVMFAAAVLVVLATWMVLDTSVEHPIESVEVST